MGASLSLGLGNWRALKLQYDSNIRISVLLGCDTQIYVLNTQKEFTLITLKFAS